MVGLRNYIENNIKTRQWNKTTILLYIKLPLNRDRIIKFDH